MTSVERTDLLLLDASPLLRKKMYLLLREEVFGPAAEMDQTFNLLKASFKKQKLNPALSSLLLDVFQEYRGDACWPYSRLLYIKSLQDSLFQLFERQEAQIVPLMEQEDFVTKAVEKHLCYCRFNHPEFIRYYKEKINTDTMRLYNMQERLACLCCYERYLNGEQEGAGPAYDNQSAGIRSTMLLYIKAELKYIKKTWLPVAVAGKSNQPSEQAAYKIKVMLSVDALAYLIRLLVEAGAMEGSPRRALLGFIARYVETPHSGPGDIGLESLLNKYKNVVQRNAVAVSSLLKKMIKIIEKDFS